MSGGDPGRSEHLAEVATAFWPNASWEITRSGRPSPAELWVLPSARSPRCLVPVDRRVAARAVRLLFTEARGKARVQALLLSLALRLRLGPWVFRDRLVARPDAQRGGIEDQLAVLTGGHRLWAMKVSRPRANRKPVLLVLDSGARPVAFVKVGRNALTSRLVREETAALKALAGTLPSVRIPRVMGCARWSEVDLLALAPLPQVSSRRPDQQAVLAAAAEIARSGGTEVVRLGSSGYWRELGERLAAGDDRRSRVLHAEWLRADLELRDVTLELGAWHGDWAPWNMGTSPQGLLVWDFERYQTGVPIGLDLVHHELQTRILGGSADVVDVLSGRLEPLTRQLETLEVSPTVAPVVVLSYLFEVCARWIADEQDRRPELAAVLDGMVAAIPGVADTAARAAGREGGARREQSA